MNTVAKTPKIGLYELSQDMMKIQQELFENEGELTNELAVQLEVNNANMAHKVEGYHKIINDFAGKEISIDDEIKRLQAKKKSIQAASKRLKDNLITVASLYGKPNKSGNHRLEVGHITLMTRNSRTVQVQDLDSLPSEYKVEKVTISPDKKAIKQALENGNKVPGAEIAISTSITIK